MPPAAASIWRANTNRHGSGRGEGGEGVFIGAARGLRRRSAAGFPLPVLVEVQVP